MGINIIPSTSMLQSALAQNLVQTATRLGGIGTFDSRGDIIWLDDFEAGLKGAYVINNDIGGSHGLSTTTARSGVASVKLFTGSLNGNEADFQALVVSRHASRIGVEISFILPDDLCLISFLFAYSTGSSFIESTATLQTSFPPGTATTNAQVSIYNNLGLPDVLGTIVNVVRGLALFHTMKLVVDTNTFKNVRLLFDDNEYDISQHGPRVTGGGAGFRPMINVDFRVQALTNAGATLYLDDLIITENEQ